MEIITSCYEPSNIKGVDAKLEAIFYSRDSQNLWDNMNIITQYKGPKKLVNTDDVTLPDKLNTFYARFDRDNKTTPAPQ